MAPRQVGALPSAGDLAPPGEWQNPCGGTRWRTLSSGAIEVEGLGVPLPPPGVSRYTFRNYVLSSWQNLGPEIQRASEKWKIPASWILALISIESGIRAPQGRAAQVATRNYCCWGSMAVMVTPYANYKQAGYTSADDMLDPWKGVDAGVAIMADFHGKGYDLPLIASRYNSGGVCCPTSPTTPSKPGGRELNEFKLCSADAGGVSYPMLAIQANNMAVLELGLGGSGAQWKRGLGLALAGVGLAAAVWLWGSDGR